MTRPAVWGPPTRFANISRTRAWVVLAALAVLIVWALTCSRALAAWPLGAPAFADLDLFRGVVDRVHAGQGYYDAQGDLFRPTSEGTRSTFNWRHPTYAWLLGALPDPALGFWLLLALALLSVVAATQTILKPSFGRAGTLIGAILLMGGMFTWCVYEPECYLVTEAWCEVFLLLSLSAYARGWWPAGAVAALAALAFRELALPYCLVAAFLAWRQGRSSELALWIAVLFGYAGLFAWHATEVARQSPTVGGLSVADWLRPNGVGFLMRSGSMNIFLRPLPPWLLAPYLGLAALGLAGWRGEIGSRVALTAIVYAIPFMIVWGNDYWGCLYTPLLLLGLVHAPAALRDLARSARRPALLQPPERLVS